MPVSAWSMNVAAVCRWATFTWYVSMFASTGSFQLTATSRLRVPTRWSRPARSPSSLRSSDTGRIHSASGAGIGVEVDEDERTPRLAPDVGQGEARRVEVGEVTGVRVAGQRAVEAVDPAVVRAGEAAAGVAGRLQDERRAPVLARVEERPHTPVVLADQDHRTGHRVEAQEVARLRQLVEVGREQPRAPEDVLALQVVDGVVAVALRRHQGQDREPLRILGARRFPARLVQDRLDHRRAHNIPFESPLAHDK